MTNNQDARPFVDLKKDAQEFRTKFDEDIKECLSFLDAKITSLICEPDSFRTLGKNVHRNALTEFSKAKYDIFIAVKSLINAKEREWYVYIAEMKKLFVENVEIFLAGTKLEVKLPPSESVSSHGPREPPGNCKSNSTSITSFIYPILSTITKNIPVGDKTQFNRRGRLSTSSIKLANAPFEEDEMETEEEVEFDRSEFCSSFSIRSLKSSNSVVAQKCSSDENESKTTETFENDVPLKGRKGRSAAKAKTNDLTVVVRTCSSDENESKTTETFENNVPLKGRKGRSAAKAKINDLTVVAQKCSSDENESKTAETFENNVPLKRRKGRSAAKAKTNDLTVVAQNCSSDENEGKITGTFEDDVPLKGRKGRSAAKAKANDLTVVAQNCSSDENEGKITGTLENNVALRGRKGRTATIAKTNDLTDPNIAQKNTGRGRKSVKPATKGKIYEPGPSKSSMKVPIGGDNSSSDELDIQTPLARPVKSAARRKTLLLNLDEPSGSDIIPGISSRSKSKRKTISGVSELETVAPSKRLKVSQKTISSLEDDSGANNNLLESDDNYSEWISLKGVDGKIPTKPAIYEVKVWRAKKSAYIGSCENLRQKLTLYNLRQNSGHKHLDKFIDRNYSEIQVRYEIISSFEDAKQEVKNRIDNFKAQHKNPPAYN